jgi:hypothetical protein
MANKKLQEAYAKCKPARDALHEADAVLMECTEDKAGIVWERWYIQTSDPLCQQQEVINVVVFATPTWWDVFVPIVRSQQTADTLAAIKALAYTPKAA